MENYSLKKIAPNSIIIEMDAENFKPENREKIFDYGLGQFDLDESLVFIQEEDFIFDINTLLYLDIDPVFRLLKKGSYPLKITHGKVQLVVTLARY